MRMLALQPLYLLSFHNFFLFLKYLSHRHLAIVLISDPTEIKFREMLVHMNTFILGSFLLHIRNLFFWYLDERKLVCQLRWIIPYVKDKSMPDSCKIPLLHSISSQKISWKWVETSSKGSNTLSHFWHLTKTCK